MTVAIKVPLLDLKAQHETMRDDIAAAMAEAVTSLTGVSINRDHKPGGSGTVGMEIWHSANPVRAYLDYDGGGADFARSVRQDHAAEGDWGEPRDGGGARDDSRVGGGSAAQR